MKKLVPGDICIIVCTSRLKSITKVILNIGKKVAIVKTKEDVCIVRPVHGKLHGADLLGNLELPKDCLVKLDEGIAEFLPMSA